MFWHKTYDLHLALPLSSPHGQAWHWTANNTTLFTGTYLHREPGCARRGEDRVDAAGRFSCSGHGGAVTGLVGVCGRKGERDGWRCFGFGCLYCFCGVLVVLVLFYGGLSFFVIAVFFCFFVWLFVVFWWLSFPFCFCNCLSFSLLYFFVIQSCFVCPFEVEIVCRFICYVFLCFDCSSFLCFMFPWLFIIVYVFLCFISLRLCLFVVYF